MMTRRAHLKALLITGGTIVTSSHWSCQPGEPRGATDVVLDGFKDLMVAMAETLIPETESPGAREANVAAYIVEVVTQWYSPSQRRQFVQDLGRFANDVAKRTGMPFESHSQAARIQLLEQLEDKSRYRIEILNKVRAKFFRMPFIVQFKQLTVAGYCTSPLGVTRGLAYDPVPGVYQACIPLAAQQRSWATQ